MNKPLNKMTVEELETHLTKAQNILSQKKDELTTKSLAPERGLGRLMHLYNEIYGVEKEMSVTVTLPLDVYMYTVRDSQPLNENTVKINEDLLNKEYVYDYVLDEIWGSKEVKDWYNGMLSKSDKLKSEIEKYAYETGILPQKVWERLFTNGFEKYLNGSKYE